MLDQIARLAGKNIVLASASPRRSDLLHQVGLSFKVWNEQDFYKES
jgi:predicted house-cleaning NTP pyrophosphatase (Maf/HAM1 superfamily)